MAMHSSFLAWRIPWTEQPGGLQSIVLQSQTQLKRLSSSSSSIGNLQNATKVLVAQSCLTLCNPMDYSLPGSSVQGILQARKLEWVAITFSRGSS